jgi:hypothetical protein
MKIHDIEDAEETVFKNYFVRKFGDIDLFSITQKYALTPTTSANSSSIWAQSIANFLQVKVSMKVESRPAILTGATIDTTRVFVPIKLNVCS